MAHLDHSTEPVTVSSRQIIWPSVSVCVKPSTFSLRALFATTTVFAGYFGIVTNYPRVTFGLTPLLCFALTFVYFTRHQSLCFGRAMLLAIVVGTLGAGTVETLLLMRVTADPGYVLAAFLFGCCRGFFVCVAAAFVLAIGTILVESFGDYVWHGQSGKGSLN